MKKLENLREWFIILQIRKNPLYVEFIEFNLYEKENKKNNDYIRNYDQESSNRSKNKIIEYALNNNWNYFVTITIDKKLHNRTNYKELTKRLRKYLNNYKNRYDHNFKYILIYEPHKKKEINGKNAIHYHGLFYIENENYFNLKFKKRKGKALIYQSLKIRDLYGINNFTLIYNNGEFLSYYISKYITKNINKSIILSKRYFNSTGLNGYIKDITSGSVENRFLDLGLKADYKNKFVKKYRFTYEEYNDLKKYLYKDIDDLL